ncbi:hypothetical protein F25303_13066 [Fusarium sp. NRRL 25303]|nr:hypothetical protein F25303_13066 [Fusarium sp. NRRL 25303]
MPRPNTIKQRRAQPGERSSATKPMFNASFTPRTVTQHDIPEWRQDNKYILAGYRPLDANYLQVVKSLTFLHNETCNVYTHLIGAILLPFFATTRFQHIYWSQYIDAPRTDFIMFSVFFCSAESCLIFSAVYHLIGSYSREVEQFWHRMDLLGIVIVTTGTLIPSIYYIFISALTSIPEFRTLRWRKMRVGAYTTLGASAFIPLLHGVQVYGIEYMLEYSSAKQYLVELLLYGMGCGFYALTSDLPCIDLMRHVHAYDRVDAGFHSVPYKFLPFVPNL